MVKKRYDVIIVGAGVGGLRLASRLKNSKLKVLLVEKRKNLNKLKISHYISYSEYLKPRGLDKYTIRKIGWDFRTRNEFFSARMRGKEMWVTNFNKWASDLKLTCDIKTNASIMNLRKVNGGMVLIDNKKKEYFGKLIIDCSGYAQVISTLLGIGKSKCDFLDSIYVMNNVKEMDVPALIYGGDLMLVNCGFWYHPLEKNKALLGISEFTGKNTLTPKELKKRLDAIKDDFYPFSKLLKKANILEYHDDVGPTVYMHSTLVKDHYLAVGDAGGSGTPFIGDCIKEALWMADAAYNQIKRCFKENNFKRRFLLDYERKFYDEFGKYYKWNTLLRNITSKYCTNKMMDKMCRRMDSLTKQEFYDFVSSRVTPKIIWKFIRGGILLSLVKNYFMYHITRPLGIYDIPRRPQVLSK